MNTKLAHSLSKTEFIYLEGANAVSRTGKGKQVWSSGGKYYIRTNCLDKYVDEHIDEIGIVGKTKLYEFSRKHWGFVPSDKLV